MEVNYFPVNLLKIQEYTHIFLEKVNFYYNYKFGTESGEMIRIEVNNFNLFYNQKLNNYAIECHLKFRSKNRTIFELKRYKNRNIFENINFIFQFRFKDEMKIETFFLVISRMLTFNEKFNIKVSISNQLFKLFQSTMKFSKEKTTGILKNFIFKNFKCFFRKNYFLKCSNDSFYRNKENLILNYFENRINIKQEKKLNFIDEHKFTKITRKNMDFYIINFDIQKIFRDLVSKNSKDFIDNQNFLRVELFKNHEVIDTNKQIEFLIKLVPSLFTSGTFFFDLKCFIVLNALKIINYEDAQVTLGEFMKQEILNLIYKIAIHFTSDNNLDLEPSRLEEIYKIKLIRFIQCRFSRIFSLEMSNCFKPPVSDELIPICNLMVDHVCDFLIKTRSLYWTEDIIICISSLLKSGDYCGASTILSCMVSISEFKRNSLIEKIDGVLPEFWESILNLLLFLDERTTFFFINLIKKITVNNSFFISQDSFDYFINTRILLVLMLQKHIHKELKIREEYIEKSIFNTNSIVKKVFPVNFVKKFNSKDSNKFCNINFFPNNLEIFSSLLNRFEKHIKYKDENFVKYSKEYFVQKENSQNFNFEKTDFLPFKIYKCRVINYFNSKISLYSKNFSSQYIKEDDIVLIKPYEKDRKKKKIRLMSFKQLGKVINLTYSRNFINNERIPTLNLYIKDPGIDPSCYKYCYIVSMMNLYFHKKKIEFLRKITMINSNSHIFHKNQSKILISKLIFKTLKDPFERDIKCTHITNLKQEKNVLYEKNILKGKKIICKCKFKSLFASICTECKEDLFSYMLSKPNICSSHLETLVFLSETQKEAIMMSLKENLILINGNENSGKTFLASMVVYCRKIIDPKSKILLVTKNNESENLINFILNSKNISIFSFEKEYVKEKIVSSLNNIPICEIIQQNMDLFFKYQIWLKNIIKNQKCGVFITSCVDINIGIISDVYFKDSNGKSLFDQLIVDDAHLLTEIELSMLLSLDCNKITLIGNKDHFKKTQIRKSNQDIKFEDLLFNKFEKLFHLSGISKYKLKDSFSDSILLTNSKYITHDKHAVQYLGNINKNKKKNLELIFDLRNNCFIDTFHYCTKKKFFDKNINSILEAKITIQILNWVTKQYLEDLKTNKIFNLSKENWFETLYNRNISIIVFHESQKSLIINSLNIEFMKNTHLKFLNLSVETLDKFNYTECDFIILSTCGSNLYPEFDISKKAKINLMNMSYKKKVIVGNSSLFSNNKNSWSIWINSIIHNNLFIDYLEVKEYFEKLRN